MEEKEAFARIETLVDAAVNLSKEFGGETVYWIKSLLDQRQQLFERFAPFREGDRVRLKKTPDISADVSWGWMHAKHFLIEGATGTAGDVSFYKGAFRAYVRFDNESWINSKAVVCPVDEPGWYCLNEDYVERIAAPAVGVSK